jgi:NAD(P)-dependent dehydrogenase (short-subunit alcohol dehydrogenase family)
MNAAFSGNVTIVTGGTGGLGRAVSHAFLNEDATVIATYRTQEEFDALAQAAGEKRSRLEGQRVDVTDEAAARRLLDDVIARYGRLDALVNTVGGYAGGTNLWEIETKVFDHMLALNLRSGYALSRAAIPVLVKQGHGSIVNIASKAGVDHPAGAAAYAASKAAAIAMMNSLAAEVAGTGVRVNSVLPSIIDTEANRSRCRKPILQSGQNPKRLHA